MGTLHHLHRIVELPVKTLDDLAREHGVEAQVKPDLYDSLAGDNADILPARRASNSAGGPEARKSATLSFLDELKADWREFAGEVRGSPVSHALVAIGAVVGWTCLLLAPLLLGLGK